MKKLFFLFTFLLAGLWATAQPYTISISGMVTDPSGDPVANVQIFIATDSFPGGPGYFNMVETNADGLYSDSFQSVVPSGYLFVTMSNCPGAPSETYFFVWQPGNPSFTADFVYCEGVGDCSVYIEGDSLNGGPLTAVPGGEAPFTYLWNTGETSASITIGGEGWYCVTVTDNTGCEAEACVYVYDPQACDVAIQADPSGALTALAQGQAPFTYLWTTGATTSTIFPNAPGQYCVTIADAAGCTSTACYWFIPGGDTLCSVQIIPQQIPGTTGYELHAMGDGAAPFTYYWSTGEMTASITVMESGTYCVTVVDAAECEAVECITIQIQGLNYDIHGIVVPADSINSNPALEGMVYLIQYDSNAGTLTAIDSVPFSPSPAWGGGLYDFGNLPAGDYLVKAFLTPDSEGYEDYLPTYYHSQLFWDEADVITLPYTSGQWFKIAMIPGVNPGGPGFIGGLVSEGANIVAGGGSERGGEGDPMANVSIILLNELEEPVTHTLTKSDGTFGLENLAWGTYKVVVEIPGMEQGFKWVTLSPENPSVNISFNVNEEGIVLGTKGVKKDVSSIAFPNPVKDQLSVYLFLEQSARGQLSVRTVDGKEVKRQTIDLPGGGQVLPVDLSSLKPGIYLLQLITGDWMVSHRIVKE